MDELRWYLAGPMSNLPAFNFPAFDSACAALREMGYEIISPHELDSPAVQAVARASKDGKLDANDQVAGETWGQILARDVQVVADRVEGIIFLEGWERSRGAKLEATVGLLTGRRFATWHADKNTVHPRSREWVKDVLYGNL